MYTTQVPIEDWLPDYDVRERHERRVDPSGRSSSRSARRRHRTRLAFRCYWLVVGPFSALIRRRWLRAVARAA